MNKLTNFLYSKTFTIIWKLATIVSLLPFGILTVYTVFYALFKLYTNTWVRIALLPIPIFISIFFSTLLVISVKEIFRNKNK